MDSLGLLFRFVCFTRAFLLVYIERGYGIKEHLHVQPTAPVYQFVMTDTVIFPYSGDNGEGAVVFVGFV